MKINLGCGSDIKSGYVNIDAISGSGVDVVLDITTKLPYPNKSVEEIMAYDVLEHLTYEDQIRVLEEAYRILENKGVLKVRFPNVDDIITRFENDKSTRNLFLFGDTSKTGIWGAHKWIPNQENFEALTKVIGFKITKFALVDTNYCFELIKTSPLKLNKIVFLNQTLGIGGAETFNAQLLNYFKRIGVEVESWTTNTAFAKEIDAHQIQIIMDIIGDWKGLLKAVLLSPFGIIYYCYLTCLAKIAKADVIYLSGFVEKLIVTPLAKLLRIPVVWVEFGPLKTVFEKFFGLPKLLYRLVKDFPSTVVVPSRNTMNDLIVQARIARAKITVIPCARQVVNYRQKTIKNMVCCVSRLEQGKGQDLLIRAWKKVIQEIPQSKLSIVGEGGEYITLKSLINDLKLSTSIRLLGRVDNALAEIAKCQVFAFPSVWELEGFGLVAVEAMALGKPVVGFYGGPLPEVLEEVSTLAKWQDEDDLADKIINLLKNPNLAKKLGQKAKDRYLKNFTFSQVGPAYEFVFKMAKASLVM